ncbi:MAG: plasmid stabilization protein [marine bacterium B5-7]|nr:MAG: plasmid stabilization protein [marine bacterium B5-7]
MKISYAPEAIEDLTRLREFIEIKNPLAAQRIANEMLTGIDKLKIFPKMGIRVAKAPDPELIRDLFIGQYTVRYMFNNQDIVILRLWHDKENEKNL